jgi:hypothetical protein
MIEELTIEEYQKAYVNMQNIIDVQNKKIEKLKQENQDNKNNFDERISDLKMKYKAQMELLAGVELKNSEIVNTKSEHAILLQSIRLLLERTPNSYSKMYSNFERIVKKDISNQVSHSSLTPKQRNTIEKGLEYQGILNIK